jgi:hypothetical protein
VIFFLSLRKLYAKWGLVYALLRMVLEKCKLNGQRSYKVLIRGDFTSNVTQLSTGQLPQLSVTNLPGVISRY